MGMTQPWVENLPYETKNNHNYSNMIDDLIDNNRVIG